MEFQYEKGRIFAQDETGKTVAEITYTETEQGTVTIDHTLVDDSQRGKGTAGKLVQALAEEIRKSGKKAVPVCSYAVKWFEKHKEYEDLLADRS